MGGRGQYDRAAALAFVAQVVDERLPIRQRLYPKIGLLGDAGLECGAAFGKPERQAQDARRPFPYDGDDGFHQGIRHRQRAVEIDDERKRFGLSHVLRIIF